MKKSTIAVAALLVATLPGLIFLVPDKAETVNVLTHESANRTPPGSSGVRKQAVATRVGRDAADGRLDPQFPLEAIDASLKRFSEAMEAGPEYLLRAAEDLRRSGRENPALLAFLLKAFADLDADPGLQIELAAVLGTIDSLAVEQSLLGALAATDDPSLKNWFVYAIGSRQNWPRDDIFQGMKNPMMVQTPGGLQLMIDRPLKSERTRLQLYANYAEADDDLRLAIVKVLNHSDGFSDARGFMHQTLRDTQEQRILNETGGALGRWLSSHPAENEEASTIVTSLMARAAETDSVKLRLLLSHSLAEARWNDTHRSIVSNWIGGEGDFALRYWAIETTGNMLKRTTADYTDLIGQLVKAAQMDANAKLREKAVRALGGAGEPSAETRALFMDGAVTDPEWNVRLAHVQALSSQIGEQEVWSQLERIAREDEHEAVRALAARLSGVNTEK